jgi:hypothetical protein
MQLTSKRNNGLTVTDKKLGNYILNLGQTIMSIKSTGTRSQTHETWTTGRT